MASYAARPQTRWTKRKGLEGPFQYLNGRVLYWDPKEGQYWDPTCDWYVSNEEMTTIHNQLLDVIRR